MKSVIDDKRFQVTFKNKKEEIDYEKNDRILFQKIELIIARLAEPGNYYQSDDWWPNHLRGIELSVTAFSDALVKELQSTLVGRFSSFRIVLHVYESLEIGSTHLFTILVTASEALRTTDNLGT